MLFYAISVISSQQLYWIFVLPYSRQILMIVVDYFRNKSFNIGAVCKYIIKDSAFIVQHLHQNRWPSALTKGTKSEG